MKLAHLLCGFLILVYFKLLAPADYDRFQVIDRKGMRKIAGGGNVWREMWRN